LTAERSVLKCHADEIALPPDHAALAHGMKFIEGQFEIHRQQVEALELDPGPGIRDVLNAAGEDAALRIKEQQRVFRNRRPRNRSAVEFHSDTNIQACLGKDRLSNCRQAATSFDPFRKQSILMISESCAFREPGRHQDRQLRLNHSFSGSACGTHNRA
jgi:hypothetical protein